MEKEISLQELFKVLWKGKFIILLTVAIVLTATLIGVKIYDNGKSQVSTIVTLQWEGIDDGQYPDGSAFNDRHLIDSYILLETVEKLNLSNINGNDLRNAIVITPIIPSNIVSQIEKAIKDGKKYDYYPTYYRLSLNNGALKISVSQAQSLLTELVEQFRVRFNKKYVNQTQVNNIINLDFTELEYVDIYQILIHQTELIESAASLRLEENEHFVSNNLKIGFNDILIRCNLLRGTTLKQISSRIDTYYLAKNEEFLISQYTHEINRLESELSKAVAYEANLREIIENYDGNQQTIILPGADPAQIIELDTYYNKLMDNLLNQQKIIIELENEIAYYDKMIERYKGEDSEYEFDQEERAAQAVELEADIAAAVAILEQLIDDANVIIGEHNQVKVSEVIRPLTAPQRQSGVNLSLYSAIALLVGCGLGAAIVLFKHKWH